TEGLVAARRCAALLAAELPAEGEPAGGSGPTGAIDPVARPSITGATTRFAGVLRDGDGLRRLAGVLAAVPRMAGRRPLDHAAVEATALHAVATLLSTAALARPESRGAHRRTDAPPTRPAWQVRLVHRLDDAGRLHTRTVPVRDPAVVRGVA
ncbi:MAG: L-aspartate oxidase, partial [Actinomycetes bacterium]